LDIMTKFALRYYNLSIRYVQEGKEVFSFSMNDHLKDRITQVLGKDLKPENLLEINNIGEEISLRGYVGKPFLNSSNYGKQYIFINGRIVRDRIVRNALDGAYDGYLMKNRYPVGVLDIRIDPDLIDVNVHPQKMEIRFYSPSKVREFIVSSIRSVISSHGDLITPATFLKSSVTHSGSESGFGSFTSSSSESGIPSTSDETPKTPVIDPVNTEAGLFPEAKGIFSGFRYIGQVLESYLIFTKFDDLFLIDQHAAAERVNYEKLYAYDRKHEFPSQLLLFPIDLDLSMSESEFLTENIGLFKSLGLGIEPLSNNTFIITSIPSLLDPDFSLRDFLDIFEEIFELKSKSSPRELKDEIVKGMACKGSIRANRVVLPEEVEQLLRDLDLTENPYNCPHGRPTVIKLTKKEIEKMFKRIL
ncbi:MAG TPA: hypothetical protein ENN73_02940, partial [Firmicutes bacterium]|nr:hypothetical protein [Bacillota bacterium]